jgi:hypothetical protein
MRSLAKGKKKPERKAGEWEKGKHFCHGKGKGKWLVLCKENEDFPSTVLMKR